MITVVTVVWPCPVSVEECVRVGRRLRPPSQRCPSCRSGLTVQGGYHRQLRHRDGVYRLWVWRGYCRPCDVSHALLPDFVVPHHLDTLDRIFASLDPRVTVDVPASTRRGWQARFGRNRAILTSGCAAAVVALGGELGELRVDTLLVAVWAAIRRRSDLLPPPWRILNIMSGGSWLRERVNSSWAGVGRFPLPP